MRPKNKLTTFTGTKTGLKMTTFVGAVTLTAALSLTPVKADLTGFGPDNLLVKGDSGGNPAVGSTWTVDPTKCCSGNSVQINAGAATLTLGGGGGYNAGSAYANTTQSDASGWTSSFTFAENSGGNNTTWAFVLQNDPRATLAKDKLKNDYTGNGSPIAPALEVVFKNAGSNALNVGFINNTTTSPLSGYQATTSSTGITDFTAAPITANLSYLGTTLTLNLTQGATTYTATDSVDLASLLGSPSAYVGFDANRMDQGVTISNFSYDIAAAPEPGEVAYMAAGLLTLASALHLRRKKIA